MTSIAGAMTHGLATGNSASRAVREAESVAPAPIAATPSAQNDSDLVAAVMGGNQEAFGELVSRHEGLVFAHLLRLVKSREDAEDLAQEAFVLAFRKLGSFNSARPFRPWLLRIATNVGFSHMRRKRPDHSEGDVDDELAQLPDERAACPREAAMAGQREEVLARAIDALPPLPRSIVHLKYREELTLEEIGEVVGKSPGAVAVALHRARLALRSMLDSSDLMSEGGCGHGA